MKRDGMQNLKFIQIVLKIVRVTVDNEPVASVQSTYDQSMMTSIFTMVMEEGSQNN